MLTAPAYAELLNEALRLDPEAIRQLFDMRVRCNDALADHPTIMVQADHDLLDLGPLGLINGQFAPDEPRICACYDENWSLIGFAVRQPGADAAAFSLDV